MMNEVVAQVQKLLQEADECTVAVPVRQVKRDGKRSACVLALVHSTPVPHEIALFLLKAGGVFNKTLSVLKCIPVVPGLRVDAAPDASLTFTLSFDDNRESFVFEATTQADQNRIVLETDAAHQIAEKHLPPRAPATTHVWLAKYLPKEKKGITTFYTDSQSASVVSGALPAPGSGGDPPPSPRPALPPSPSAGPMEPAAAEEEGSEMGALAQPGGKYNPFQFSQSRDATIQHLLRKRQQEYTRLENHQIAICSWNVNGKVQQVDLSEWLCANNEPEIVVIGLQEIVDLNAQNLLMADTQRAQEWEVLFFKALNTNRKYKLIARRQLVGIYMAVFVREDHHDNVSDVMTESTGCGLGGWMGNKGGVGIRFRWLESTVCFVNSHLDADKDKTEGRNSDMKDIADHMAFKPESGERVLSIYDHDSVFWFGDLNYRIQNLSGDEVKTLILAQDWDTLLRHDQLSVERRLGNCFVGFTEAPIDFAPTYKYDIGTDVYDTSEKKRTPAWCDRVLWKGDHISCSRYARTELKSSDHRPVSCELVVGIRTILPDALKEVYQTIVRELDRMENDMIPDVKLHTSALHFDHVAYDTPQSKTVVIENVGKSLVQFLFIPKMGTAQYCKPWLSVTPLYGMILTGESIAIKVDVQVSNESAWDLNSGDDELDDVLILHLDHGRDFFIHVTGQYQPSVFGSSLDQLVCLSENIRECALGRLRAPGERKLSMPKELWRLCDHIHSSAKGVDGLFRQSGVSSEIELVREALDVGTPFPEGVSPHSMAEAVLLFLESLKEPVIPTRLFDDVLMHHANAEAVRQVVLDLPPVHYNVFVYLMSFLREVLQHCRDLRPKVLAGVFAEVLMRKQEGKRPGGRRRWVDSAQDVSELNKRTAFLLHFLQNEDYSWGP